ncbi:AarF/UbiB family protein [Neobacillus niacini]|uniref:AarF/UbiB family protein n=1 Tax=Neobacillus niacini TaxID=86668 RepID=UPI003983CBFA
MILFLGFFLCLASCEDTHIINFKLLFKELKQVVEKELNFKSGTAALLPFQERFKESILVKIPHVYTDLSASHVLVMDGQKEPNLVKSKN